MAGYGCVTASGLNALAKAAGGKVLKVTRMEYGNGTYPEISAIHEEKDLVDFCNTVKNIKSKMCDIDIIAYRIVKETYMITGVINENSFDDDFDATELAIYAKAGEEDEILFGYYTLVDYLTGEKRDNSKRIIKADLKEQHLRIIVPIAFGSSDEVTFNIIKDSDTVEPEEFEQAVSELNRRIDGIDLSLFPAYDIVIDSDEKFLEWANTVDASKKNVLVKTGTWTLDGFAINVERTGTRHVTGMSGAKLIFNNPRGFSSSETETEKIIIENLDIEVIDNSSEANSNVTYGVYYGGDVRNCNIKAVSKNETAYGLYNCTADNVTSSATGGIMGFSFYDMNFCTRCRCGETASTTATWGGTNTFIDSETCDL